MTLRVCVCDRSPPLAFEVLASTVDKVTGSSALVSAYMIGNAFLLKLMVAVSYKSYRLHARKMFAMRLDNRIVGAKAAFDVVAICTLVSLSLFGSRACVC
jgi:hypothetical protein